MSSLDVVTVIMFIVGYIAGNLFSLWVVDRIKDHTDIYTGKVDWKKVFSIWR